MYLQTDRIGVLQPSTCIYRCSMDVSQLVTDRIGVLQRLYTSTCILQVLNGCLTASNRQNWCPAASVYIYMYSYRCSMDVSQLVTDRIGQVLNGCLAASNRQNWCPAASVYIYMYLQLCTVQLYAHTWQYICFTGAWEVVTSVTSLFSVVVEAWTC
jgi:hypothetical protein